MFRRNVLAILVVDIWAHSGAAKISINCNYCHTTISNIPCRNSILCVLFIAFFHWLILTLKHLRKLQSKYTGKQCCNRTMICWNFYTARSCRGQTLFLKVESITDENMACYLACNQVTVPIIYECFLASGLLRAKPDHSQPNCYS